MLTCFINTFHLDSVFYIAWGWEGGTPPKIRFVFPEFGIFLQSKKERKVIVLEHTRMIENLDGMYMGKNIKQKGKKEEMYSYDTI